MKTTAARFFRTLASRLGALMPQRRDLMWDEYLDLSQALNRMTDAHTAAQRRVTELERTREQDRDRIEQLERWLSYERQFSDRLSRQERADAVDMLCAHQLAFMDATLTHPYAREVLAHVEEPTEHVTAMREALAAPARALRADVIEALADILHAAGADGHEPEDLNP